MKDSATTGTGCETFRTVLDELRNVMPRGTADQVSVDGAPPKVTWDLAPAAPTDLFGAVAHLLRVSGAMGWFEPSPARRAPEARIVLSQAERDELKVIADRWRQDGEESAGQDGQEQGGREIQDLWTKLVKDHGQDCLRPRQLDKGYQGSLEWCRIAFKLLLIADQAAEGVGRPVTESAAGSGSNFMRDLVALKHRIEKPKTENSADRPDADDTHALHIAGSTMKRRRRHPPSIATRIDTDVACILPKSRVAQVGCTMRSLTANLALLPPRASVRCQWAEPITPLRGDDRSTLDILLIPAPFEIHGIDFEAVQKEETGKKPWGNFSLNQSWLKDPSELVTMTTRLIRSTKRQTRSLNAIMFPEYALDWESFDSICKAAWIEEPSLEFIIAGASENCEHHKGNHVLTALRHDSKDVNQNWISAVSRRKHHRWRLDAKQVSDYALASALNPAVDSWWESHDIYTPELYFHRFRQSSTFVTMICEDLARSDPCHEIIRSVGPNLVFALLMDGPQLPNRWGARYASGLADDPGCSVMTFTSWGLIRRINLSGKYPSSRSIALWKDETGCVEQILMPAGDGPAGVLVSLAGKTTEDWTLDGRKVENCSWRFHGQQPVLP